MKYNIISGFSDEISEDVAAQFKILNKLGISYFEPRGIDGKNISELTDAEITELKKKMADFGIKASSIGSPIGKIKISDNLDDHFEKYKRIVEIAKKIDSKYIRIFSFYHDSAEWIENERLTVLSQLPKMIEYAKANNVVLLHENEKDIYGDTADRCKDLMENLYCDNFKAVFDPANFVQSGQDTKEAFEILKPYIEYMHIKEALFADGSVVPAGFGDGNIEYILSYLLRNGYNGYLSIEPHLGSFKGLESLERGDIMNDLPEGGEGTFTLAYNALIDIIDKI